MDLKICIALRSTLADVYQHAVTVYTDINTLLKVHYTETRHRLSPE